MARPKPPEDLIRTTVMVPSTTWAAIKRLADEGARPLTWEVRRALEDHVERQKTAA